jgi:hypothetical protein
MAVLFRLWRKVKIFLMFVKLELLDVFLLPNPMKMTLKAALKFLDSTRQEKVCDTCKACVYFVCYFTFYNILNVCLYIINL